jgi:hypothetical protein
VINSAFFARDASAAVAYVSAVFSVDFDSVAFVKVVIAEMIYSILTFLKEIKKPWYIFAARKGSTLSSVSPQMLKRLRASSSSLASAIWYSLVRLPLLPVNPTTTSGLLVRKRAMAWNTAARIFFHIAIIAFCGDV